MSISKENRFLRILLETFKEDAARHFLLLNDDPHHQRTTACSSKKDCEEDMLSPHTPDTLRSSTSKTNQRPPTRGGVVDPFPSKLHSLLENREYEHIISWQPHGRCFLLHDKKGFIEQVMPLVFKQTTFASFQRQLNLYDFNRICRTGPDKRGYYHELFLRGRPELAFKMIRTKIKGCRKKPTNPFLEPNFYEMPFLPQHDDPSSLLDHPDSKQEVMMCASLPNNLDDDMVTHLIHNLLSPSPITPTIEDSLSSLCEPEHQKEEEDTKPDTSMSKEVTATVAKQQQEYDSEIGVFVVGNHFTSTNDDHVSDSGVESTDFYQMPFVPQHDGPSSLLDHPDEQALCASLPNQSCGFPHDDSVDAYLAFPKCNDSYY